MREILAAFEQFPTFEARELAEAVGSSSESVRRALRTSGHVVLLGTYTGGAGVWCSPDSVRLCSRIYGRREGFTLSAEAWKR